MKRFINKNDKEIMWKMWQEFYSSDAVFHDADYTCFQNVFDAIISPNINVTGYLFTYVNNIAGYAITTDGYNTEVGGKVLWLEDIFLKDEYHGKGIAKEFLTDLISEAKKSYKRIRLEAVKTNDKALGLYYRMGFTELDYKQLIIDFED